MVLSASLTLLRTSSTYVVGPSLARYNETRAKRKRLSIPCDQSWSLRSVPILHLASLLLRRRCSGPSMRIWLFRHHLSVRVSLAIQMILVSANGQTFGFLLRDFGVPSSGVKVVTSNCCNRYSDISYSTSSHGRSLLVMFGTVEGAIFYKIFPDAGELVVWCWRTSKLGSPSLARGPMTPPHGAFSIWASLATPATLSLPSLEESTFSSPVDFIESLTHSSALTSQYWV